MENTRPSQIKIMLPHKDWEQRNCPLCNSNSISLPEMYSRNAAEKMSWLEVKSSFVGLRKDQVFFSYYRCLKCSLLYCPWYFSSIQLSKLYAEMPINLLGAEKKTTSKTQRSYVKWIARDIARCERFLEFGPDIGILTAEIMSKFKPKKIVLIEPNHGVHKELRENIGNDNEIEIVDFLNKTNLNKIDLLVGVHVFDHFLDPFETLVNSNVIAKDKAIIAIVVHNEKSFLRKILNKRWPPFCLQHPQLFNPESLSFLLEKASWTVLRTSKTINYFKIRHLTELFLGIVGLPKGLSNLTPNIEIPIILGNIIICAKKDNRN